MVEACKTCGKPPLANRAGSVTSYFFQHNYCRCAESSRPESHDKSQNKSLNNSLARSQKATSIEPVCSSCGKSRPENRRAGSFTSFLFKELRCTCSGSPQLVGERERLQPRKRTALRVAEKRQFTQSARPVSGAGADGTFEPATMIGGAFLIEKMIGKGGMGVVYRAQHMALKRTVALKVLAPEFVNEQSWQRFKAEARTLAALNHDTLVKVYDLGIHDKIAPYYSMDYLTGHSLEEVLVQQGSLPLATVLEIFIEVLDGLAYAHRNNIVHRDLKPGNIMLCTVDGASAVKILDFGISKFIGGANASAQSLTSVGDIFGSPFYMSPEQCSGRIVDARSDIYSIGCTIFEALTGFVPFESDDSVTTVLMHQEDLPPRLAQVRSDLSFASSLERLVAKCLAKRPDDRYQSAKELQLDLMRLQEGKEILGRDKEIVEAPQAVKLKFYGMLVFFALALLVMIATALYLLLKKESDNQVAKKAFQASVPKISLNDRPTLLPSDSDMPFQSRQHPSGSQADTAMFSSALMQQGNRTKRFAFPGDVNLGTLLFLGRSRQLDASGEVEVPAAQPLVYSPAALVADYPQYLKRFRAGDIYGISLAADNCSDAMLAACSNIPEIQMISLGGESSLTAKSIHTLNKFKSLRLVAFSATGLSGNLLAQANCWSKLTKFTWHRAVGPTELLHKLESAAGLTTVDISSSTLSEADFSLLAKIKSIETLTLARDNMTVANLATIGALPQLKLLDIRGSGFGPEAIPVLKQFKNLKGLKILQVNSSPQFKQRLINQLPNVRIYEWKQVD